VHNRKKETIEYV